MTGRALLSHVSVGVADAERARRFYGPVMATLGVRESFATDHDDGSRHVSYGEAYDFWLQQPAGEQKASAGVGAHVAFVAPSREAVDAFYASALAQGGADDGAPGPRPQYTADYYAAFVRDPDGNRLEVAHAPSIHGDGA